MTTVVGLDTSLTATGLAKLADHGSARLTKIGSEPPKTDRHPKTGKPLPATLNQRVNRIQDLAERVTHEVHLAGPDLVVIEAPSHGSKGGQAHERAGLWWTVVMDLRRSWVPVVEVSPSVRPIYAAGKGTAGKYEVLAAVSRRYSEFEFSDDNEADALVLAMMGMRYLGCPLDDPMPQTHLRAMDKVMWPG